MNNFLSDGDSVTITAGGTVASGAVVKQGQLLGIATHGASSGQDLVIKTRGVFRVTKVGSQQWTVGAIVYWNGTAFTTTATGALRAGVALEATGSGSGETTGVVRLDGVARVQEAG
jgi:predicted RecA/RadA family phage recombinase